MSKTLRGAASSAPLFGPRNERTASIARSGNPASRQRKVARKNAAVKKKSSRNVTHEFLDGIVDGERVVLYTPPSKKKRETERQVELRARIAIAARGAMVKKHVVECCASCGAPPKSETGLGKGTSDLLCIVNGRACFIEMKRPGYSPSDVTPEQRAFIRAVRLFGGVAGIATSEDEALALIEEARGLP